MPSSTGPPEPSTERTPLAGRNLIECENCGEELEERDLAREVKWSFWDKQSQNFERGAHFDHFCQSCWNEEFKRDAAAYWEVQDAQRLWDVLEAADGELVADLKHIFVGGRPWIRVVDGELQALSTKAVPKQKGDQNIVEFEIEEIGVGLDWFEDTFQSERELPDDEMPTIAMVKPADETPFADWEGIHEDQTLLTDGEAGR